MGMCCEKLCGYREKYGRKYTRLKWLSFGVGQGVSLDTNLGGKGRVQGRDFGAKHVWDLMCVKS